MFKQNKKLIFLFACLMAVIIAMQYLLPKPADLSKNYLAKNKAPFGCYAIYNLLDHIYSKNVKTNRSTFYNLSKDDNKRSSFLIINNKIDFNSYDTEFLYSFLNNGNTVFIAAEDFSGPLNDSLHIRTQTLFYNFHLSLDSLIKKPGTTLKFSAQNLKPKKFSYPQLAASSYFTNFDSTRFKVLASIADNKACLIKGQLGEGTIYLMSMPDLFGNYFIVDHKNREAAYAILSLIKNDQLIWDEYYKTYNVNNASPIKFILESDSLYAAYVLAICGIILYMIFESRRRQKQIPVIVPPKNSTLEFINVVSHVYYNSKNHKSIALEKIKYFYETVRKKFNVNTNEINEGFYEEVSELSGIDHSKVRQLFQFCIRIHDAQEITEYELIELNRQIEIFNKNSLR